MALAEQKDRMTRFIAERLEDSRIYNVVKRDGSHILVAEKPGIGEHPREIYLAAHNDPRETFEDLKHLQTGNALNGIYTAHAFFKDGQTYMVRLARRGNMKGNDRSLKNYDREKINAMVHLRGIEKAVLTDPPPELAYYQPETERLPESLRIYTMGNVNLDYSHLRPDSAGYGFAHDTVSKDFRLPEEKLVITIEPARLELGQRPNKRAIIRRLE